MKVITICGSLKYQDEMVKVAEKLTLEGNCVLSVTYPAREISLYTKEDKELMGSMHKEKIKISDAIYVLDIDGYIGSSTQSEIELAVSLNKEVIYYSKENN